MLREELTDQLKETLAICDLHHQRMQFAWQNVSHHFPLTATKFSTVTPIEMAFFDQLIYRFSKLQDNIGARLFKQLLAYLEEEVEGVPLLDILQKMEKLQLLDQAADWITLRQTRNAVSHDYPFDQEIQIEELNLLPDQIQKLSGIWIRLQSYTLIRLKS